MEHHFFAYVSRMKFIQRWGLMRNTLPENDMEHAFQTAMVAHAIAVMGNVRYQRSYNAEYIMALAVYHDSCEVITGDLPTPIKYHSPEIMAAYKQVEKIAADKLLATLPESLRSAFSAYVREEDESVHDIVKAADKLSAYIKCVEEQKAGNTEFDSAAASTLQAMKEMNRPELDWFMNFCLGGYSLNLDQL